MKQNNLLLLAGAGAALLLLKRKQSVSGIGYAAARPPFWYGIDKVQFVYHGDYSDPEIYYRGKYYNGADAEDWMYNLYREEMSESAVELDFDEWMRENGDRLKNDVLPYLEPTSVWTQPFSKRSGWWY